MMPGTASECVSAGAIRSGVDFFGEVCPSEPVRVEMRVTVCLSFEDVVGLLAYRVVHVSEEDLDDANGLRDLLQHAVLDSDLNEVEAAADAAERVLQGRGGPSDPPQAFLRKLGAAVTREFGLAPQSAAVVAEVSA